MEKGEARAAEAVADVTQAAARGVEKAEELAAAMAEAKEERDKTRVRIMGKYETKTDR